MSMQVAQNILSQLGGNRFIAMTGASNLLGGSDSLSFKIGRNPKGITHVRIKLTPDDLYDVEFLKARNLDVRRIDEAQGVYGDSLQTVFTHRTGLDVHL